jgi:hypothetical protein
MHKNPPTYEVAQQELFIFDIKLNPIVQQTNKKRKMIIDKVIMDTTKSNFLDLNEIDPIVIASII